MPTLRLSKTEFELVKTRLCVTPVQTVALSIKPVVVRAAQLRHRRRCSSNFDFMCKDVASVQGSFTCTIVFADPLTLSQTLSNELIRFIHSVIHTGNECLTDVAAVGAHPSTVQDSAQPVPRGAVNIVLEAAILQYVNTYNLFQQQWLFAKFYTTTSRFACAISTATSKTTTQNKTSYWT